MRKPLCLCAVALAVVVLALAFVGMGAAQDFVLPYNKAPETAEEFWAASKLELQLGNHKRSGEMLQKFAERLANQGEAEQDKLLLQIHDRDGLSTLLRLANLEPVKALKATSGGKEIPLPDALIKRMTKAIEGRLSDQSRIEFFVGNLGKSAEERAYAMLQLRLAGDRAVPALLKVLSDRTREKDHVNVVTALARMDRAAGPAMLAGFDAPSDYIRAALIRIFEQRGDKRVVPYLWWLHGSPKVAASLKAQAGAALAKFLDTPADRLTDARGKLTAEADRWYRHEMEASSATSMIWSWDNATGSVVAAPATKTGYDDRQAMYWAQKALDVDANFVPAQVVFVSAAIDRAIAQFGPEQPLRKSAPEVALLLAATGAPLLDAVLDRALVENRTNVALGAARAIGANGDPRSLRPEQGGASPLSRALSYADGRVQFAAAEAVLSIPAKEAAPGTSRVVNVLARALGVGGSRKIIVGHGRTEEGQKLAGMFRQAGYDAQAFGNGRQLAQAAEEEGDLAFLALHANLPDPGLVFTLTQLGANANTRGVAIILFADDEQTARDLSRRYPKLKVISPIPATADLLKAELDSANKEAPTAPVSEGERKAMAAKALELLNELAEGALAGYNVAPADGALTRALASDELAAGAAKVLARRQSKGIQAALADTLLRETRTPAVRAAVAAGLRGNLQRFGVTLSPEQITALVKLSGTTNDPALKEQADRLAAFLEPSPAAEGQRLLRFPLSAAPKAEMKTPADAAPAKDAPAKDDEKKDEKKEEKKDGA